MSELHTSFLVRIRCSTSAFLLVRVPTSCRRVAFSLLLSFFPRLSRLMLPCRSSKTAKVHRSALLPSTPRSMEQEEDAAVRPAWCRFINSTDTQPQAERQHTDTVTHRNAEIHTHTHTHRGGQMGHRHGHRETHLGVQTHTQRSTKHRHRTRQTHTDRGSRCTMESNVCV